MPMLRLSVNIVAAATGAEQMLLVGHHPRGLKHPLLNALPENL